MSEEKEKLFMCTRKAKFDSEKYARDHLRRGAKEGRIISEVNVYLCKFCNSWHIGHKKTAANKRYRKWLNKR